MLRAFARILLIFPLLGNTRAACGATPTSEHRNALQHREADCHHPEQRGDRNPQRHHDGGMPTGHCPSSHTCAADISLHGPVSDTGSADADGPAARRGRGALSLLSQLPEVPPPRA